MSTTYDAPPHDYLLDCYRWLANADYPGGGIYPNYLRETFDDRAQVVWVSGRYVELWQTTGPHDQPAIKHANIKHAIFGEIQRIKERSGNAPAPAPRPVPSPSQLEPLTVDVRKRWFRTSAGLFDYREVSAFSLLALWLTRQDEAIRCIDEMAAERFTVLRVMVTLDGPYWVDDARRLTGRSLRCAPDMPGYEDGLVDLVRYCGAKGLYVRIVIVAATEQWGGVWHPDRRDIWLNTNVQRQGEAFQLRVAGLLKDEPNVLLEQANEPVEIGLRHSAGVQRAIARQMKQIAPRLLMNGGAVSDLDYAGVPYDFVDEHLDRRMGVGGMEWVKRAGEALLIDQPADHGYTAERMPFVSGEPVNFGDWRLDGHNGDVERNVAVAFAYGACSRARQFNTCFHFDNGLWCLPMGDLTKTHARAYHAALDAFPMLDAPKWRGSWAISQGNYWNREQWPSEDAPDVVEAHVRAGKGPWRVFGCGPYSMTIAEPQGWDFRRGLERDFYSDRLAFVQGTSCNSGVYVRR